MRQVQSGPVRFLVAFAALTSLAPGAGAQAGRGALVGRVRDSAGTPIASAQVTSADRRTLTDTTGWFALDGLPTGSVVIRVRRLGFEPRDATVTLAAGRRDSVLVMLVALPVELEGVRSEATRLVLLDFHRHKQSGGGRYFDREQIEAFNASLTSDILRRLPGIELRPNRNGRFELRMRRAAGNCPPDFWIDGVRAPFLNIDDIPLNDIEALEVYNGPAGLPPEYLNRFGNPACGAVVIWTRVPG